ncbi:hypothetical protein TREMEDRAFT_27343 [Tremella mesenterica DSM 1558]|uniref:uncharacterized protein n=1 Tax=Tremella mesenterica (strain ATCC 24925 / CBS 8224 / DSM 1558 / NBRC 9311 / NRRL Y-6157 / RJB 2259-6 / UBC 559-6) TaxID=578456 RepID=UPI0003F48E45|nr:uncharacterized protein TREMEDRAFT_27343 [Tremella mesenterica DSM 1558]EIW71752.1 hypothetical protein TREMEDRAFT_27343 [Tremella mesenterica DSM 1558]
MFKSKATPLPPETDYTKNLRETSFYRYGNLRSLGITGEIASMAVDPLLSLFAIGTTSGLVHCFGEAPFQFTLPVAPATPSSPPASIKFLLFHPGNSRLIAIDAGNTVHSYSLAHMTDSPTPLNHPPLPTKEGAYTLFGVITAVDQPMASFTHLFLTMQDGATLCWDSSRRAMGSWRTGNCWGEFEEKMVRSGLPGRHKTLGGPQATCLAINPRDINVTLIGYEGGVVAWDFQKNAVVKTFEMLLPPGAPGGSTYEEADNSLWTERTPAVSFITWRPDGLVFVVGHADGCMTFWAYAESDKPLMVRTVTHEDVNVTDAESLFSAGALNNQTRKEKAEEMARREREPIFKLAWVSFPDQAGLKAIVTAQTTDPTLEPPSNATAEYVERGETLLLILGGQCEGERPGINILQFPAYQPPPLKKAQAGVVPSESLPLADRYAFRDSLMPTGSSYYPTKTPPEDFILLPRSNPYFNLSHDPIALIISLTPDPSLSSAACPARGLEAWAFPPPRSNVIPPSPGRKNFVQPGEGEKVVAVTPAPILSPPMGTPKSPMSGWKLPWTSTPSPKASFPAPSLRVTTPDSMTSIASGSGRKRVIRRRQYRMPASLWTGSMSVLGCELHSLPTPTFKKLISFSIENSGNERKPRLPIRGGMAVPDLQSHGAPEVKVTKMESYRLFVTWHPDACVRFWDASPHILVLPTPLRFEYPGPLPHLTISIGDYLKHPDLAHQPLAKLWQMDRSKVRIKSVHLTRESLECIITMVTGEVIVTKFGQAKVGFMPEDEVEELDDETAPRESYFPPQTPKTPKTPNTSGTVEWAEEMTEIGHLAKWAEDGFKPVALFSLRRGEPIACAVSDIGFIAVAFSQKSLAVFDMRGPDVILREGFDQDGEALKRRKKKGNVQNVPAEQSLVGSLQWVVSGMGPDPTPRPRLIVSYSKGMTKIYTLVNVLGEWMIEAKPPTFTNESLAGPLASFIVDPATGNEMTASAQSLSQSLQTGAMDKDKNAPPHCLWIAASKKSIRCAVNYSGERVAKVELEEEELSSVFYITRHGQKVLVALTTHGTAIFYSVPFLEYITTMDLSFGIDSRTLGKISMDDRSGDFVEYHSPNEINLRTLFLFRKPLPPRLDACTLRRPIPAQPQPVGATWGAWIWGGAPLTGAALDAIVAGPTRPPLPKPLPAPKRSLISWGDPPDETVKVVTPATTTVPPKRTAVKKQTAPNRDSREREDAYTELVHATQERGNYLDDLGEHMNQVSISASNYLSSARNAAMKQAAKTAVTGVFGKLM